MIIIGEKINGAIPKVAQAIESRDEGFIKNLAVLQTAAGADYIDVCAGTAPEEEENALIWLLEVVQNAVETRICIDSPNPSLIKKLLPMIHKPGIINSVSGEGEKCDILYPLMEENEWQVIALACNDKGIPADSGTKAEIALSLIEKAGTYGISPNRIHIDPLVLSLSAVNDAMINFLEAIYIIKNAYPTVNIAAALSNISYGMPVRKLVNQGFLTLSMQSGLDTCIMDPLNRDIYGTLLATEALLNRDKYCRRYNKAYRAGLIGAPKK